MMTREEVDELVSSIAASYDPAPSIPNSSRPLFAITGSRPIVPDVRKVHAAVSNEASREIRQKDRLQKIDLELAAAARARPQSMLASYDQALSWIRYRCPEKLNAGFGRWYHGERDRCIGLLRKALETGDLIAATDDGREMLPAAWGFIEPEAVPNVRFRWADLYGLWPAAFLDALILDPDGARSEFIVRETGSSGLLTDERVRRKKIFAWLVCQRANQPSQRGEGELNLFVRTAPTGTFNPPIAGGQAGLRGSWNELFLAVKKRGPISDEAWPKYVKIAQEYLAEQGISVPEALPSYSGGSGQPDYSYPPNF
jgi:hypothetical protein